MSRVWVILLIAYSANVVAAHGFLRLPFIPGDANLVQGPLYADGSGHFGGGYGIDYAKGGLASSNWKTFPVFAAADGVAIRSCEAGEAKTPFNETQCDQGFGHFVLIRHDARDEQYRHYFTLYAHLDGDSIDGGIPQKMRSDTAYASWRKIKAGDYLGMAGQSGLGICKSNSCTHLHLEVFRGGYFLNPIDPYGISNETVRYAREDYPEFNSLATCGEGALWKVCPTAGSPDNSWVSGDGATITEDGVRVRSGPTGQEIRKAKQDEAGKIIDAAVFKYPYWWWHLDFDNASSGWVAEQYLLESSVVPSRGIAGPLAWEYLGNPVGGSAAGTFLAITAHPQKSRIVLAGSTAFGAGVYRSTDAGESWTASNKGILQVGLFKKKYPPISKIVASSANPDVMYLGTGYANPTGAKGFDGQVYRSDDQGGSWKEVTAKGALSIRKMGAIVDIEPCPI